MRSKFKEQTIGLIQAALVAAIVGTSMWPAAAQADTTNATWTGGGSSANWGNTGNWQSGQNPNGGGSTVIHFAGTTGLTPFNNYNGFTQFNQILFDSNAGVFNLKGAAIKLAANGGSVAKVENNSAEAQTISFNSSGTSLVFIGSGELDPTQGDLTINNSIFVDGTGTINVFGNSGRTLTLNGSLNNGNATASLAIQSDVAVKLNVANTYTGDTVVNAGKLQFGSAAASINSVIRLGNTSGGTAAEVGLTADGGGVNLAAVINPRGGGTRTIVSSNATGTNMLSGHIGADQSYTIAQSGAGTLNITSVRNGSSTSTGLDLKSHQLTLNATGRINVSGTLYNSSGNGSVSKIGGGTAVLSAANTYAGGTTVTAGTLVAANTVGSAAGSGAVTVSADGTLAGTGTIGNGTNALTVQAGGTITAGDGATAGDLPGTLTTGNQVWQGGAVLGAGPATAGGTYAVKFADSDAATGGSAASWDVLAMGTLNLSALSSTNRFNLVLLKTATGTFDPAGNDLFTIATATALTVPSGHSATDLTDLFALDTTDLGSDYPSGSRFTVSASGSGGSFSINVDYEAAPEPATAVLAGLAGSVLMGRRRRVR